MTREHDKFQIEFAETNYPVTCVKCTKVISYLDDPQHVILWPPQPTPAWRLHIICYGDVTAGMAQFFKVFVIDKKKERVLQ